MNTNFKLLVADIDENNNKIYDVDIEIKRNQKNLYLKQRKNRNYTDFSLRLFELKNSKTVLRNKIDALKQIFSHIEEARQQIKLKIKHLKNKTKNIPEEKPFEFTDFVKKQKEGDEIDLGLFLGLAEEKKIV